MADSELCEVYGWTWQELQDTPLYVRVAFQQIQAMKNAKQAEANKQPPAGGHRA